MEIAFTKLSPTQNVTILVESGIPRAEQSGVAAKLLACDSVGGEQVGFIEPASKPGAQCRLQMMGGEFCGNASMSMGAYLARQEKLPDGAEKTYPLEVSGAEEIIRCRIVRTGDAYRGTVCMPVPERIGSVCLATDRGNLKLPCVYMPGITHVIVDRECGLPREEIERSIRRWNESLCAEALGVLLYDEKTCAIEPVVYVPATDSAVWERGCGSGTAALGSWLAAKTKDSIAVDVSQPGGAIRVCAEYRSGQIAGLTITGTVRITAKGIAYV